MGTSGEAVVVIGGGAISPPTGDHALVIAADGGYDVARAAGLEPSVIVGDLDSLSEAGLQWAQLHHVDIRRHPTDKDQTDTALAIEHAIALGADSLLLCGPDRTDRIDHLLGAVIALGAPLLAAMEHVSARLGSTVVHVLHPGHSVTLDLPVGAVFSVLALHGASTGVQVVGARWPLTDATLPAAETRGISNSSTGRPVTIAVSAGVLTVIVPGVAG